MSSEDLGLAQLRLFLSRAGVPANDVQFEEGSGLSRNNLTTPQATFTLLQYMSRHPASNAFWSALPVAGVDGTLRNRLKNTPAQGKVLAKTGTLRWASSLSGQLKTATGETLLFSLMLNRYAAPTSAQSARAALDDIVLMLVNCGKPGN
jgi:D-alanyl-D-alanine carboxypeptidase/D-alanyl-D-alanine-endopeptidase (penicillin-binding protein 4)